MSAAAPALLALATEQFADLTDAEKKLIAAAAVGVVADYSSQTTGENNPRKSATWGAPRTIRAQVIRWLCIDREGRNHIDPKGIRLDAARIDGQLDLEAVTIPFPLILTRCAIRDGMNLMFAETRLLSLVGSSSGAINGSGLVVHGHIMLGDGFRAVGEVQVDRATITGDVDCEGGVFLNPRGIALSAHGITVNGHVFLRNKFRAAGEVQLIGATITGNLDCSHGHFRSPGGVALRADGITVSGPAFLRYGFRAAGLVRVVGSKFGVYVDFRDAHFSSKPQNGLIAEDMTVAGIFDWRVVSLTKDTILTLAGARVGQLADDQRSWPASGKLDLDGFVYTAIFDGPLDAKARKDWLKRQASQPLNPLQHRFLQSKPYRPQPYQQLAKVLRESGQEVDAKRVLIAKEKARRKYGDLGWATRSWSWVLGATIGHGYRPYLALLWAVFWVVLGGWFFYEGCRKEIMLPAKKEAYPSDAQIRQVPSVYPAFSPFMYSLDTFLPIINFGQKDFWWPQPVEREPYCTRSMATNFWSGSWSGYTWAHYAGRQLLTMMTSRLSGYPWVHEKVGWLLSPTTIGSFLRGYRWFHIAIGWVLITLFVAGFTSLVRKE